VSIERRTVLVTGASRGIGEAICQHVLGHDCNVIGIARSFSSEMLSQLNFTAIELDLSQTSALEPALKKLRKEHPAIDGVICNAGQGRFGALEQFSRNQIEHLINLNLTSQVLIARAFLPQLKARGQGDLIFMGSEAALSGGKKGAVYCATKFALRGLAQSLREECAVSGVRVGIINPGMVMSDFFNDLDFTPGEDEQAHLKPQDVADAVWLMLSARQGAVIDEINLSPQKRVIEFRKA
jgi:3-hydroxy acid dehydrogenase/malonic semialdehyde reductase